MLIKRYLAVYLGCLTLLLVYAAPAAPAACRGNFLALPAQKISPHPRPSYAQLLAKNKNDLAFFFQSDEQLTQLFFAQKDLLNLGNTWKKFEHLAHEFAKNKSFLAKTKTDLRDSSAAHLTNLQNYLTQHQISLLSSQVFIQRLPAIYNIYLTALKHKLDQIIMDLRWQAYMSSNFDTYLSNDGDAFFHPTLEPKIDDEDRDDRQAPDQTFIDLASGQTIAIATNEVGLLFKRVHKYEWKHLVTYNAREHRPDHQYVRQIIQQIVETFDNDLNLLFISLRLGDINDVLRKDARQGKFIHHQNLNDAYFLRENNYGGKIGLEAAIFSNLKIHALSDIVHELGHTLARNHDFHLKLYRPSNQSSYTNGFYISEVSARIKELDYLKEQLDLYLPLTKNDAAPRKHHREIQDILANAQRALEDGLILAQQTQETFIRLQEYFTNPDQTSLRFNLTECDDLNQICAKLNGHPKIWSVPAPQNNHHLLVEITIAKIGTFKYLIPLTTNPDYSNLPDPIFNHYPPRPLPRTIRASLQRQVERWDRFLQQLRQTLQGQEREWEELQKQAGFKATN